MSSTLDLSFLFKCSFANLATKQAEMIHCSESFGFFNMCQWYLDHLLYVFLFLSLASLMSWWPMGVSSTIAEVPDEQLRDITSDDILYGRSVILLIIDDSECNFWKEADSIGLDTSYTKSSVCRTKLLSIDWKM